MSFPVDLIIGKYSMSFPQAQRVGNLNARYYLSDSGLRRNDSDLPLI